MRPISPEARWLPASRDHRRRGGEGVLLAEEGISRADRHLGHGQAEMHVSEVDEACDLPRFRGERADQHVVVVRVGMNHGAAKIREGRSHARFKKRQGPLNQEALLRIRLESNSPGRAHARTSAAEPKPYRPQARRTASASETAGAGTARGPFGVTSSGSLMRSPRLSSRGGVCQARDHEECHDLAMAPLNPVRFLSSSIFFRAAAATMILALAPSAFAQKAILVVRHA